VAGFHTKGICQEFGVVFWRQGEVELRPVFRLEVDRWNIYSRVK
jgi:hypothetical protein